MTEGLAKDRKKNTLKEIILALHQGLSFEEAKERVNKEIGVINSSEIAGLEQSLIDDGVSPEVIKKFCNVHALLFEANLEQGLKSPSVPHHPVNLFTKENREIEKLVKAVKILAEKKPGDYIKEIKKHLENLRDINIHYMRKEQILFPYLEKKGFMGPSKVMWGKDNEIRDLSKKSLAGLEQMSAEGEFDSYYTGTLKILLEEVEGMIFKEENILFPASLEKLDLGEWAEILKGSREVGYAFIRPPEEVDLLKDIEKSEKVSVDGENIVFPTGTLTFRELVNILNVLPVDISFVDKNNTVKYYSDNSGRSFVRAKSVIGRQVENCHPPQSLERVKEIVDSFRQGKRDKASFWINMKGKVIYINFFALRDAAGNYLGTLEVVQDITEIKKLEGEKRLL